MTTDNLSQPLLRMARFFLIDALPPVHDVRDVYEHGRALRDRGIAPTRGEERLLRQIVWCMLQIQNDELEGEQHRALARLAALVLAVMEDDVLEIPDDRQVGGRLALEGLAIQLLLDCEQTELQIGAAIGTRDLGVAGAADVLGIQRQLEGTEPDPQVERALRGAALHLRQGEEILRGQTDPVRHEKHRQRFEDACARTKHLLARLFAVPPDRDAPVVRKALVRRELRRIEVDALGTERISEAEQIRESKRLLAWTEVELGEAVTDENRARLAEELRKAAAQDAAAPAEGGQDDGAWLFEMGEG